MDTQPGYPRVTAVLEMVAEWWKRRDHHRDRLEAVTGPDVEKMARDIGITAGELRMLARQGARPLLLPRMLDALHIDAEALSRHDPVTFRDLQRVCALCDSKRRCAVDLAEGDAAETFESYCPNALTLKSVHWSGQGERSGRGRRRPLTGTFGNRSAASLGNSQEFLRLEARAAHPGAVHVLDLHQLVGIGGPDGTAVENAHALAGLAVAIRELGPDQPVDLGNVPGRGGEPRADGPDRLLRDDEVFRPRAFRQ